MLSDKKNLLNSVKFIEAIYISQGNDVLSLKVSKANNRLKSKIYFRIKNK